MGQSEAYIGERSCEPVQFRSLRLVPWCSGLTCVPVKDEIAGSNPVGTAVRKHSAILRRWSGLDPSVRLLRMPRRPHERTRALPPAVELTTHSGYVAGLPSYGGTMTLNVTGFARGGAAAMLH